MKLNDDDDGDDEDEEFANQFRAMNKLILYGITAGTRNKILCGKPLPKLSSPPEKAYLLGGASVAGEGGELAGYAEMRFPKIIA